MSTWSKVLYEEQLCSCFVAPRRFGSAVVATYLEEALEGSCDGDHIFLRRSHRQYYDMAAGNIIGYYNTRNY